MLLQLYADASLKVCQGKSARWESLSKLCTLKWVP